MSTVQKVAHASMTGDYRAALISVLEDIPAAQREEAIASALEDIAQKERRALLLAKINNLDTAELERLVGAVEPQPN